jgi:hypothetical protein
MPTGLPPSDKPAPIVKGEACPFGQVVSKANQAISREGRQSAPRRHRSTISSDAEDATFAPASPWTVMSRSQFALREMRRSKHPARLGQALGFQSELGVATSRNQAHLRNAPPRRGKGCYGAAPDAPHHVGRAHQQRALLAGSRPRHLSPQRAPPDAQPRSLPSRLETRCSKPPPQRSRESRYQALCQTQDLRPQLLATQLVR